MGLTYKKTTNAIYDAEYESDRHMTIRVGKKFAVLFIVLLLFDPLLDLLASVLDMAIEAVHLGVEILETLIEDALDFFFSINHVQSEIIMFNGFLLLAGIALIVLVRILPRLLHRIKRNVFARWLHYKRRKAFYWRHLPWHCKIKLIILYTLGISGLSLLVPF